MFLFGNEKVSGVPLAPRALSGMRSGELMPCCTCSPVTFQNEINIAPWKSTRFRGQIRLPTVRKKRETQREGELNRHDCQILKKNTHTHKIHKKVSEYFTKGRAIKIYRCRFREKKITGGISLCCESLHFIQENAS